MSEYVVSGDALDALSAHSEPTSIDERLRLIRVLLDTATPVERRYMSADVPHDARWAWVHTRDEEAP